MVNRLAEALLRRHGESGRREKSRRPTWRLFHFFALMNREVIGSRRVFYVAAEELSLQDPSSSRDPDPFQ
ncbi:MAG: hypothetical protein ABJN40_06055 [Sneathiella sp.]